MCLRAQRWERERINHWTVRIAEKCFNVADKPSGITTMDVTTTYITTMDVTTTRVMTMDVTTTRITTMDVTTTRITTMDVTTTCITTMIQYKFRYYIYSSRPQVNDCTDAAHGVCRSQDVCLCQDGFTGADCRYIFY
jgi:hypothetical protein